MASLLQRVRHVFNSAQDGHVVMSRLCQEMADIHMSSVEGEFWEAFVHHVQKCIIHLKNEPAIERVIDFISHFATHSTRLRQVDKSQTGDQSSPSSAEDSGETMDRFLLACFNYLISLHNAREKAVRLRCCQLVNKMLNLLGDQADIDEDLSDSIYECMMVRLKDVYPPVRNQAALALSRLQDPGDEECPVIDAYLNSLSKDIHFLVRKTILTNLAISRKTLPYVIERTRDVKDVIRKTAFTILAQKVSIRALSIAQRIKLVTDGLKTEASVDVKKSCLDMLKSWFRSCQHQLPKLLCALDTESAPETSALAVDALLEETSIEQLTEYIGLFDTVEGSVYGEIKLILHQHLTPELVFFWYSISKHLKSVDSDHMLLQKILPELTHYCSYIRKYAEENFIDSSSSMLLTADGSCCEFIMEYLLKIAGLLDLSDEIGRRNLRKLLHDLLLLRTVPVTLVGTIVKLYKQIESNEDDFIQSLAETISDIKQPMVLVISQAMKEKQRMMQLQLCRVKAMIQECADDLECAVKQQDFKQAAVLKENIVELEKQKGETEVSIEECSEQVEDRVECDNDPQTILKCLTVGTSMLSELLARGLNATLMTLKDELFIEGVKNEDPAIRNEAVRGLGLLCLMKKEFAAQHLVFFLQVVQIDQEFVKLTAVKVIFDLFLMYGMTNLDNEDDGKKSEGTYGNSASAEEEENLTVIPETPPPQVSNDDEDNRKGNAAAESVLSVLLLLLQNESSDLRCAVAEGLAKLLMTGRIVSVSVLSRLIVLWYNPVTEDDVTLRHCLGVFFPTFAFEARKNQQVVADAFLPTLRTITNAPDSSPLSYINVSNVIDLFVQLTDVRNLLSSHKNNQFSTGDHIHDSLATKIANEILSDPEDPDLKVLCKTMNQLCVCPQNKTAINDLIDLSRQMLDALKDNRTAKKSIEKFYQSMQLLMIDEREEQEDAPSDPNGLTEIETNDNGNISEVLKESTEKHSGQIAQEEEDKRSRQRTTRSTRSSRSSKNSVSFAVPKKIPRLSKPSLDFK